MITAVIGSGFGGSPAALRCAEAGDDVVILERGPHWASEDVPAAGGKRKMVRSDTHPDGWFDMFKSPSMRVAMANGVGGGSLVYANVFVTPPEECLRDLPFPVADLARHYATTERYLKPIVRDKDLPPKGHQFARGCPKLSRLRHPPIACQPADGVAPHLNEWGHLQGPCRDCGDCSIGCRHNAKNTLSKNYLAAAEMAGAEILAEHEVLGISTHGDKYQVAYINHREEGKPVNYMVVDRVIVSAGSIRTTELLLRSERDGDLDISDQVGQGWAANGDYATLARYPYKTNSHIGTTITSAYDMLDKEGFFAEDGGLPGYLRRSRGWKWLWKLIGGDNFYLWFGQSKDASNGTMTLDKRGRLQLDWDARPNVAAIEALRTFHLDAIARTGGKAIEFLPWTLFRHLVTPHPLGGCALGRATDKTGRLRRKDGTSHKQLYVIDGSLLPRSVGLNPSKTIAAVSEYLAGQMTH